MENYTSEEEEAEPKTSSQKLQEKFRILEKDYEVFSKSSFKNKPKKSLNNFQKLVLDDSPRYLMSTLQDPTATRSSSLYYCSPVTFTRSNTGEVWRVRTNELAKEEVRRERKLAFEGGKLRGRRLFEKECEVGSENDNDEMFSVLPEVINVEKGELSSCLANKYDSYYHGWGHTEEEKVVVKEVTNVAEKAVIEDQSKSTSGLIRVFGDDLFGGKTRVLKIFVAFALICFVLGNYLGFDGQAKGSDIQVNLLPT